MSSYSAGKIHSGCGAVEGNPASYNKLHQSGPPSGHQIKLEVPLKQEDCDEYGDYTIVKSEQDDDDDRQPDTAVESQQQQQLADEQKLLQQEQELQKQLYSGSNVAPGWRRVTHNNKIIYIR